jgi:hypothetical protein
MEISIACPVRVRTLNSKSVYRDRRLLESSRVPGTRVSVSRSSGRRISGGSTAASSPAMCTGSSKIAFTSASCGLLIGHVLQG